MSECSYSWCAVSASGTSLCWQCLSLTPGLLSLWKKIRTTRKKHLSAYFLFNPLGPGFTPFLQNFAILQLARRLSKRAIQTIQGFGKSCSQNKKKRFPFSVWGFLEVMSQKGHVLEILPNFGQPWALTHWPILFAQSSVEN